MAHEIAHILVAEDNIINQKLILHILKKLGFEADLVNNGNQVLEAIKTKQYDLILMDIHMPEMGGVETTIKIKEHYINQYHPAIIAVTAGTSDNEVQSCMNAGMDDFISKPFMGDKIGDKLTHWVELSRKRPGRK